MKLRQAVLSDCRNIYIWRNHELNRKYSHNSTIIPYKQHREWFAKNYEGLFIGYERNPIGVIRFVNSLISIYLVPGYHGNGYGKKLLQAAIVYHGKPIKAEILPDNIASIKIFEACGFKEKEGVWYYV